MNLDLFMQVLVNGLMSGGVYALVASGFTLILGVIQVFNFAQSQFYMLGAYVTFATVANLGFPYPVAIIAALLAMFLLGIFFHFFVIQWTLPHGFFHTMLVTIAFGNLVAQLALLTFASKPVSVVAVLPGVLAVGGVTLQQGQGRRDSRRHRGDGSPLLLHEDQDRDGNVDCR